jgi:hypothetical protein
MHTKRFLCLLLALAVSCVVWSGCGHPQVAPEHLRLTAELRTAISTQNAEWLERAETLVEQHHQAGEMSDREYKAFRSIIDKAHDGAWDVAEREVLALQKAQRPTREQAERVRQ